MLGPRYGIRRKRGRPEVQRRSTCDQWTVLVESQKENVEHVIVSTPHNASPWCHQAQATPLWPLVAFGHSKSAHHVPGKPR